MSYNWDYLGKNYNNKMGIYKFNRIFEFIITQKNIKFESLLDIAGGSGRFAVPLSKYFSNSTVLDINPTAIQILRERDPKIKAICGDFTKTDLNGTFSLILCIEALGYFQDLDYFFSKINTILENNGRFIFTFNNPNSWKFLLKELWYWKTKQHTYNEIKLKYLKLILQNNRLEIVKTEGMNWIPLSTSSNSKLVSVFACIEKIFRFKHCISQSPWILFSVKKY